MEKLKNESGDVAVLVSHGYGVGWFSWNPEHPECLFDPDIARAVLSGASADAIEDIAKAKWPDEYWGGAERLRVHWVTEGRAFRIDEYDGSESLVLADDQAWIVA